MRKKYRRRKKRDKVFIFSLLICVLCLVGIGIYYLDTTDNELFEEIVHPKKVTIVDEKSNERPIAVMIDNNAGNNIHAGLQESYINYEIIVEGGYTRIMALFKDRDVKLIGPVRSSRHYFLDYSMESDAIYAHFGWSTFAENDIKTLGINNINGLTMGDAYWRDNKIAAPHNVYTNKETLLKAINNKKYSTTTDNWKLLNYTTKVVNLHKRDSETQPEGLTLANNIDIVYSKYQTTSYQYDSTNKYYMRFMNGDKHIDKESGEQLHYKNIIIERVRNYSIDSYGRQNLETTGTGDGYYITNGYALPITWGKDSRSSKTVYKYVDGSDIDFNDGNTFIQVIPEAANVDIK